MLSTLGTPSGIPDPQKVSLEANVVLAQWGPPLVGCLLRLRPSNETRGQPQSPMFPPTAPNELEDKKSSKGQEKHPSYW